MTEHSLTNQAEGRWWSKLFIVSALVALLCLVTAPLGHKYGFVELLPAFGSLIVSLLAGAVIVIVGTVMIVVAHNKGLLRDRNLTALAVVLGCIPIVVMLPQMLAGRSVPPIHDITTDVSDPPLFQAVLPLRADAGNPPGYGSKQQSAEELAALQEAAYPAVTSLETSLPMPQAVARAAEVLGAQGLELVDVSDDDGRVEATATTFWFGFKDDVVVRVRANRAGSTIDVRSKSRVGQSDLGANAARVIRFLEDF